MTEWVQDIEKILTDQLSRILQASRAAHSVRACLLTTRDRDYAFSLLKKTARVNESPLYLFTLAGRRRYNPKRMQWEIINDAAEESSDLFRFSGELQGCAMVVFEDCALSLRDDGGDPRVRMMLAQMLSDENPSDGHLLIFIEPPESEKFLPSILADQFVRLDVPYPRPQELESIAKKELARSAHNRRDAMDPDRFRRAAPTLASGMVGLTRSAARDALRDALAPDGNDFDGAFRRLQERKKCQLSRELAMNVLDTATVEMPVGLDNLTDYLMGVRKQITSFGPERARGILLIGPPGTGKTMLARAIGSIVDLPVVEFRISSLMNSLLGETERRFSQAFATLEAMSPNIVFIDEIEKAFGDSSERDGGTMMRCTGALLSWLSDNPYPNFIVATSNSLKRMGEIGLTMTRSERFDAAFFVDVPGSAARTCMIERWLPREIDRRGDLILDMVRMTEKFSGADLRSVIKRAMARSGHLKTGLTPEIIQAEIERKRMRAAALYDEFHGLREWGRIYCDPAGSAAP